MKFIFNLTRREIRSSWRRLLFFFLCIALGVGSIVALRSLIQNLTKVVGNDARALMTADVEVSSTNDFSPSDVSKIEDVVGRFPIVEARNETISTASMARPQTHPTKVWNSSSLRASSRRFLWWERLNFPPANPSISGCSTIKALSSQKCFLKS